MQRDKFNKKVRFSYLLPYGLVSPQALELGINDPSYAYSDYTPGMDMKTRLDACSRAHFRRLKSMRAMVNYGYIEDVQLKFGSSHWEVIRMYRLTKAGFFLVTNTPNQKVEEDRLASSYQPAKRLLSRNSYLDSSIQSVDERQTLYKFADRKNETAEMGEFYDALLCSALEKGDISLLASEPKLAESIRGLSNLRTHQQYKLLRYANVEALFKANRFLTSLDRRPLIFQEKVDKEQDKSTPSNIPEFSKFCLSHWYENHPESLTYLEPLSEPNSSTTQQWESTPAFYCASEIPGFESYATASKEVNYRGANNIIRHSFVGLATGRKTNYIVYHTRPVKTQWSETVERGTSMAVKKALDSLENTAQNSVKISKENEGESIVKNAIMICTTINQFAALFTAAKQNMPKRWAKEKRVGRPYQSLCIVPLNHSGSMQLRCLMYSSPAEYEAILVQQFLSYPGFSRRPTGHDPHDHIYKLSYNKLPVFLAHCMDFQKLYWAMDDHSEGKQFYVACYPEQVKYIKKIMPNVEFL